MNKKTSVYNNSYERLAELNQQISQKMVLLLQHSDILPMWCKSNIIFCDTIFAVLVLRVVLTRLCKLLNFFISISTMVTLIVCKHVHV